MADSLYHGIAVMHHMKTSKSYLKKKKSWQRNPKGNKGLHLEMPTIMFIVCNLLAFHRSKHSSSEIVCLFWHLSKSNRMWFLFLPCRQVIKVESWLNSSTCSLPPGTAFFCLYHYCFSILFNISYFNIHILVPVTPALPAQI